MLTMTRPMDAKPQHRPGHVDRRQMDDYEKVLLWLRVHDEKARLVNVPRWKLAARIAFNLDMEIQTVRRVLRQRLV